MTALELAEQPTALYRWYGQDGRLLYVGISFNPVARSAAHAEMQPWWSLVRSCTVQWYETRSAAETAEARAIWEEEPACNRRGTEHWRLPKRRRPATEPASTPRLVTDLLAVFPSDQTAVWSEELCERLGRLRPELYEGWQPTALTLALKQYGVRSRQINRRYADGHRNRRGFLLKDIAKVAKAR